MTKTHWRIIIEYPSQYKPLNLLFQDKMLLVNLLLESFSNAQTIANNYSSRFDKHILLNLKDSAIDSTCIKHFLLERQRLLVIVVMSTYATFFINYYHLLRNVN